MMRSRLSELERHIRRLERLERARPPVDPDPRDRVVEGEVEPAVGGAT